jgi:putative Mn2+ efflux pump MntP
MTLLSLLALGVGLAMDATAVAAATGLAAPALRARHFAAVALLFGGFQAAMPVAGWLLGRSLGESVAAWDHWIAFVLLGGLGVKMLYEARASGGSGGPAGPAGGEAASDRARDPFAPAVLLALAVATSIDALAVGVTLPIVGAPLAPAVAAIGVTTGVLSAAGLALGHRVGARFGRGLEAFGGVVLVGLGAKILVEHLW